jgi:hypothetical protein
MNAVRAMLLGASLATLMGVAMAENSTENGLVITLGRLSITGPYATQVITLENKTSKRFSRISIECGFYARSLLVGVGEAHIKNIEPRSNAHGEAVAMDSGDADNTKCRINSEQ